jgi:hypothetical protein
MPIEHALRRLAEDYGLNASILGFMEGGFVVRLGDTLNGVLAERNFSADELDEVGAWLLQEARLPRSTARAELSQDGIDQVIDAMGIATAHIAAGDVPSDPS